MDFKRDYNMLLEENQKLKRDLKSKQSFISEILKQKKELNQQVSLLFSELEMFKEIKMGRLQLRVLKAKVKAAKEMFRIQMKVRENNS